MKKNHLLFPAFFIFMLLACTKKNSTSNAEMPKTSNVPDFGSYAQLGLDSPFTSIDSANKMITSYQNGKAEATDLNSLIIDAEALRYYLQNSDIKHIKLMFAHKLSYINSGHANESAGMDYNALTLVIAGYNGEGNYVY